MTTADTDRNLLFGILALQVEFIGKEALIKAVKAWVSEKSRPLGLVLLDQGALDRDRYALVEGLVREHLKQHGGDVQKSLAAVGAVGSVREVLQAIADPDVQATLTHIPPTVLTVGGTPSAADLAVGTPSVPGLRFRILRPHARGGLGQVSVARDEELHREVALKEIQDRHADHAEARARFLLEAEVTGGLEHPGIVPVYGLGHYADGRPFYAMRFIRGDSLQEAVERFHSAEGRQKGGRARLLALRDLLGRFVDVCNALAYAHARGVLHRDLKPGNIMLGPYGETLVVDWGLAKPLGKSAEPGGVGERPLQLSGASSTCPTLVGSVVGTPPYMSPEQAAGRLEELGPASDVYSLGATLYCLLTGKPPVLGVNTGEILGRVQRGEFPPPRALDREVPAALEAVCLKAMRLRPEERYPSARELAADVERWLADEPVSAYREPLAVRAARWARRHRTLVMALAVLLVTGLVALAVSTALVAREQARTEEQRRQAEANFQTALGAVDSMLTEVAQEQLANEPRMQDKQRALLARAKEYYTAFLGQKADDPRLREETARALARLGDISRLLGRNADAREAYGKAIALFGQLDGDKPGERTYREGLAHCYNYLGEVYRRTGRPGEAAGAYREALGLERALIDEFGGQPGHRLLAARSYYNLGILVTDPRQIEEAEGHFRASIDLLARLAAEFPKKPEYRQHLARAYLNRGTKLRAARRLAEAEATYRGAIRLQTELVKEDGDSPDFRYELAGSWNNLGNLFRDRSRYREAEAAHREALGLLHRLVLDFPRIPLYRADQANALHSLGLTLEQGATVELARGAAACAVAGGWGGTFTGLGELSAAGESWARAGRCFEEARVIFDGLTRTHADVPDYRANRAMTLESLGWYFLRGGQGEQARRYLADAVADLEAASRAEPGNGDYHLLLSRARLSLFDALLTARQHAPAADQARALARESRGGAENAYLGAVGLALCARVAAQDLTLPAAERPAVAQRYADQAVACLGQAVDNGFADPARVSRETAWNPLRQRDDFRQLLARVQRAGR
jgi:serine/threonine-protein kinase